MKTEFDVKPDEVTNDLDIAGAVANRYVNEVNADIGAKTATGGVAVITATYGTKTRQVDVTAKVRAILAAGERRVQSNTELAGYDPAPGQPKVLTLFYSIGASPGVTAVVRENDAFYFPVPPNPPIVIQETPISNPVNTDRFFGKSPSALDEGAYNIKKADRVPNIHRIH